MAVWQLWNGCADDVTISLTRQGLSYLGKHARVEPSSTTEVLPALEDKSPGLDEEKGELRDLPTVPLSPAGLKPTSPLAGRPKLRLVTSLQVDAPPLPSSLTPVARSAPTRV